MSNTNTITRLAKIPVTITDENLVSPDKYIRIENSDSSLMIAVSKWQTIRDRFKAMANENPNSRIFNYDIYLNREKTHKLLYIESVNSGGDFIFNIIECESGTCHSFSINNDFAIIQSKAAKEKNERYIEENKELIKERNRASYNRRKKQNALQESKSETVNEQIDIPNKNNTYASRVPDDVLTFLMSIVDHNKLAEVKNRLASIKKEAELLESVINFSGNN